MVTAIGLEVVPSAFYKPKHPLPGIAFFAFYMGVNCGNGWDVDDFPTRRFYPGRQNGFLAIKQHVLIKVVGHS